MRLTPDFDAGAGPRTAPEDHRRRRRRGSRYSPYLRARAPDLGLPIDCWTRAAIVQTMLAAARTNHKPEIAPLIAEPSNIGNYFAAHGIDTTCGFGVTYENLHAPNERITLDTIKRTSDVYSTALHSLLDLPRA